MAEQINDTTITEMEGTDDEVRIVPVSVIDKITGKTGFGYDLYNSKNNLIERVGYKTGLIELNDGSRVSGDTLVTGLSLAKRDKIKDYVSMAKSKSEVKENG